MQSGYARRILYVLVPALVAAFPQSPRTQLPQSLQTIIPSCAQSCLASFLTNEYPSSVCPNQGDLDCLCSHYGTNGFTLGEGAFECASSFCNSKEVTSPTILYNICTFETGAVTPTHSTLTITLASTSSATLPSASVAGTTPGITSTAPLKTSSQPLTSTTSFTFIGTSTAPPIMSSLTSIPTASPDTEKETPTITSSQIIGISVSAGALFIVLVAAAICMFYMRRRKYRRELRDQKDDLDFSDVYPRSSDRYPFEITIPPDNKDTPSRGNREVPGAVNGAEKSTIRAVEPAWPLRPQHISQIGLAVTPTLDQAVSLPPPAVDRRLSKLLPAKPELAYPASASTRRLSLSSQATEFEDAESSPHTSLVPPSLQIRRSVNEQGPAQVSQPVKKHQPALSIQIPGKADEQATRRQLSRREPPRPIGMPRKASVQSYSSYTPPLEAARAATAPRRLDVRPQVVTQQPSPRGLRNPVQRATQELTQLIGTISPGGSVSTPARSTRTSSQSTDDDYLPRYYSSTSELTDVMYQPRRSQLRQSRNVRYSSTSETSFESADLEDPTPPEENKKALTPVAESPISNLRYPKVPRDANSQVARSPGQRHSPAGLSPSGLSPARLSPARASPVGKGPSAQSPVNHAPVRRSPIGRGFTASDLTMSQKPPSVASSNPSSLLVKRRGDHAAQDLESRLYITRSNLGLSNSDFNSFRGSHRRAASDSTYISNTASDYGFDAYAQQRGESFADSRANARHTRILSDPQTEMKMKARENPAIEGLKSPLWEPKLTPTRKGEDLYIQVSSG